MANVRLYITYDDPLIAMNGQMATTGETADEYSKRLANRKRVEEGNKPADLLYDKEFVITLPYCVSVEVDTSTIAAQYLSPEEVFRANLKASFNDDITQAGSSNAAVSAATSDGIGESLHASELCTTELGGNDAINSYWSFNENDDIIYPVYALDPATCKLGLGRVYAQTYQKNQVILWMSFGVPKYCGLYDFFADAINKDLASELHSGSASSGAVLGRLFGGALAFGWKLFTLPAYVLNNIGQIFTTYKITKYYELKITMPQYFRAVNTMMNTVAANMGIQAHGEASSSYSADNLPSIMKEGCSMEAIMTKRRTYFTTRHGETPSHDDSLETAEQVENDKPEAMPSGYESTISPTLASIQKSLSSFSEAFMANATVSTAYIGFRVEKSVDASESFSNTTRKSELDEKLNSLAKKKASTAFNTSAGNFGNSGIAGAISDVVNNVKDFFNNAVDAIDVTGLAGLLTNVAYFNIPEMYDTSSFSTSYNFKMDLVSHYTDPVSIFQNLYVPMFAVLGGALPRQVGNNTYVEPFICRAFCKGRFAITLGIIDSVSITRGSDEYGWTHDGFPTRIQVSWTIKDLAPILMMSLTGANGGTGAIDDFLQIFAANGSMLEYLNTLSAFGLKERDLFVTRIRKKLAAWWNVHFDTKLLNPYYWGSTIGNNPAMQVAFAWKYSRLSDT